MVIQTIRKKRPLPARQLAEMYDVTPRTIMRWAAQTRADWIDEQAAGREAIRAYHDDDGHSWTQTAKHFHLSLSTVKERAYRARKERAAEAEEKARNEVHKNEVPLIDPETGVQKVDKREPSGGESRVSLGAGLGNEAMQMTSL